MRLAHMNEMPLQVVETLIDRHVRRHQDLAGELRKSAAALRTGADAAFEHRHRGLSKTEMSRLRTARAAVYDEIVRSAKFEIESAERLRKVARELGKSSRSRQTRSRGKPTS